MTPDALCWNPILERLAKAMHDAQTVYDPLMADEWDDVPNDGIEHEAWLQSAAAVVREMQAIMDEHALPRGEGGQRRSRDDLG